jgi:serine protease Do
MLHDKRCSARPWLVAVAMLVLTASHAQAREISQGVSDLVAKLLPGVVNVSVIRLETVDNPMPGQSPTRRVRTVGSGFFVDPSGFIVTNFHVVDGAREITVTLQDQTLLPAQLFAQAKRGDIALLKVETDHPMPTLHFGDSDDVRVGDPVLAVGNPLGFGGSVSAGIVSALNRDLGETPFDNFIQSDAAINHGNSGGPLFNLNGDVIGVNTAIYSPEQDGGSVGLGFSIPGNDVRFVINRLRANRLVHPGWLGVRVQEVTPELADAVGLDKFGGAAISGIDPRGSVAKSSLKMGDVILTYDGRPVTDTRALARMAASTLVGRDVPIKFWRDGHEEEVSVKIQEWPLADLGVAWPGRDAAQTAEHQPYPLGLALAPVTDVVREIYQIGSDANGVAVLAVSPEGAGGDAGLKPGDVIVKVQHEDVHTAADVERLVDAAAHDTHRRYTLLLVQASTGLTWIPLPLHPLNQAITAATPTAGLSPTAGQ